MKKLFLTAVSVLLTTVMAMGAGYQLNLQGLRQLAMGGSGTAYAWDASTLFYNPAGLSSLNHIQASGSLLFLTPSVEYAESVGKYYTTSKSQTFTPINIYVGGPVRSGSPVAIGIGLYTPFGSGLNWGNSWTGRYVIEDIELRTYFLQPTISYKFNDVWSVGAGFVYAFGSLDMKQAVPVQNNLNNIDPQSELYGRATGIGFNAGIHIKPTKWLHIGLTYRSQVNMKTTGGSATFTDLPSSLASTFPNTTFSSTLPLPATASIGFAVKATQNLTLQFDVNFVGWQTLDSLRFNFAQNVNGADHISSPRNYRNRAAFRLGGNLKLGSGWAIMAGTAFDPTPAQATFISPDLPDADRILVTGGFTYKPAKKITLMAAIEYVTSNKINGNFDFAGFGGKYQTKALTTGIGMSYNF
ncbi:MAG: outer membrane protein transport protein [Bacteroidota bacterium]